MIYVRLAVASQSEIILLSLMSATDYQGDLDNFYEALTNIPVGTAPIDVLIDGAPPPPSGPKDKT